MNKLKLCPFCGTEPVPAYRSGAICVVSCPCCKTDGPNVIVGDYLDFSEEITDEAWNEAVDKAKAAAVEKWNTRPPMTDWTWEELAEAEKRHGAKWNEVVEHAKSVYEKKHSAALYGANCREG